MSTTKLTKSPLSKCSPGHNRKLKSPKKSIVKSKLSPVSENDNSKNLDTSEPGTSEKSLVISKLSTGGENDNSKNLDTSEPDSSLNPTSESMWIPNLGLFNHDREVLLSESWLNDNIVYATENLLSQQTKDANIYGWQSPQLVKTKFKVLPPNCKYIQVLNVHKSHWITISNINIHDDTRSSNSVSIYDSNFHSRPSPSTRMQICSFVKPTCKVFKFDVLNTMPQPNAHDCGVFALACATDLAHGHDPVLSEWNIEGNTMRMHLLECLERGHVSPFPTKKKRRIPLGRRVHRTIEERIYCICRLPNLNKDLAMICCNVCHEWHHERCMDIDINDYSSKKPWICFKCTEFMDSLV